MSNPFRRSWVVGLTLAVGIVLASDPLHAQTVSRSAATKISTLRRVPPEKVPHFGTFWLLNRKSAPLPINRFPDLPVYYLGYGNSFLVDDSSVDWTAVDNQHELDRALRRLEWESGILSDVEYWAGEGGGPGPMAESYGLEDLWLEITGVTNDYAYLTLHGTVDTDWYQLESKTNLAQPGDWILGEIKQGDFGANQTIFSPVYTGDITNRFFRAHHANAIVTVGYGPDAFEPSTIYSPGLSTPFSFSASPLSEDLTVYYQVSGTASTGVDYTNLPGAVVIPANSGFTDLILQPIADNLVEGTETVILTIVQTNSYLIDGNYQAATNQIKDSTTQVQVQAVVPATAVEPNGPPGSPAASGTFQITRSDYASQLPPLTVFYTLSGQAGNGLDYANLTGTLNCSQDEQIKNITIDPIADNLVEGAEAATLTLLPTTNYVVPSESDSDTVWVADSSTTVEVSAFSNAVEPHPASTTPKQTGIFSISRRDDRSESPALTVSYQLSGTAADGVDYTNVTGMVTFLADQTFTNVFIEPIFDDQLEADETVVLTITHVGDGYLINPASASATLAIYDNLATNTFQPVVANLNWPVGIDYYQPSNSLIVSVGNPTASFVRIFTNVVSSNILSVVSNWSGVTGLPIEVKLMTVKTTANGFTNGDVYFGSGNAIGWLSADGTRSNLTWCVLTNSIEPNALPVGGSLSMDVTGVFSNQLIVVTSPPDRPEDKKGVWRVDSTGHPTLLTNFVTKHLEGVISLANDASKWGPWAGKIVTGDENENLIYTVGGDGVVTQFDPTALIPGGIRPEDFDVIPPNQDLYLCGPYAGRVYKLDHHYLTNYVGDLVITDAGEFSGDTAQLFILHWDAATTNFITRSFPVRHPNGQGVEIEHVTFAPLDLPPLP